MLMRFTDKKLQRLATDDDYDAGFGYDVVTMFRRRVQLIRDALDERDFYRIKSLHFEKLAGDRAGQHSMRLNDQFRLIVTLEEATRPKVARPKKKNAPVP